MRLVAWLRDLSAVAAFVFLLLLLTSGWGLMSAYVPSDKEAFDSVLYLRKLGGVAALLRDIHTHLASGLVSAGALYLLTSYLLGLTPRQKHAWWAALALFFMALLACFTGFLLPMDQNAYWGTIVRLGIVETVPVAGGFLADLMRGGPTLNASTLTRFYAVHVQILPALALVPLGLLWKEALAAAARGALHARRTLLLALALTAFAYLVCATVPAALEPRAAPGDTEYVPRPEWYFLWLFQIGKYVESLPWLRSLVLPAIGMGALLAAPLLPLPPLKARAGIVLSLSLAFFGFSGLARYEDRALPEKPTYEKALQARAAFLFKEECTSCHGATGKGDGSQAQTFGFKVPDFTSAEFWKDATDDRMRESIKSGKGADMPAFGKKLPGEEIDALLTHVKHFPK